ncbi:glycosyltransferase family 2 protein [Hyunsoonleella pacifica]|uniref:glycosyltransferase family 2 protein n=1 Tax=Hyunsoonleella pacifica TaxID=1080224 RepID=UPI0013EF010C|nr:glycosyltransferase family 2 protein [Hyunsoonleella pacifica]GGD02537.1 hypothetical protein GCM10011368_00450 [Hyunsoonleella pacifica]
MADKLSIAVIIPFYNASRHIISVVDKLPSLISKVYIVDDCSTEPLPFNTLLNNEKVELLKTPKNLGVGGATKTGFIKAIEDKIDIVIKVDADGQMDTTYINELLIPLKTNKAQYAKGNRFRDFKALKQMPFFRKFGNLMLSFFMKAATGYWNNFDPTNGFFAVKTDVLKVLDFSNISNRFYFETSLLAELYFQGVRVSDVSMPAIYGDEKSNMKVWKMPFVFMPRLVKTLTRRIIKTYFIYDFNISSIYMLIGFPLFFFGVSYGSYTWWYYSSRSIFAPTGTIMLVTLTIIIGFQLLLQAIHYDILRAPKSD